MNGDNPSFLTMKYTLPSIETPIRRMIQDIGVLVMKYTLMRLMAQSILNKQ